MEKKKRINKYDIIIYISLIFAIVCIGIAIKGYYDSLEEKNPLSNEIKEAVKEMKPVEEEEENPEITEPSNMLEVDKEEIINNDFNSVIDKHLNKYIVTRDMLLTWGAYHIKDIEYVKTITENYYCYKVSIDIPNIDASIPTNINEDESSDEIINISLYIDIAYNPTKDQYSVKEIEQISA